MTVEFHAVLGEPGLMPGQADDVEKLREAVINHQGAGAGRGYHAVGLSYKIDNASLSSGTPHPLDVVPVGTANVAVLANDPLAARGPGWETAAARLVGATRNRATPDAEFLGMRPTALDAQTFTVVVQIGDIFYPLFSGWAYWPGRVLSTQHDSFTVHAREYISWLGKGRLTTELVEEQDRDLPSQDARSRIRLILALAGYAEHDLTARYLPNAVINSDRWDFFLPRSTRIGLNEPGSRVVPADLIVTGGGIPMRSYIENLALVDEASFGVHHGLGAVTPNIGTPDRLDVPGEFGFPGASVQTEWGGSLYYRKWGRDPDTGLYTTGGLPSNIVLQYAPASRPGEISYYACEVDANSDKSINQAIWQRRGEGTFPRAVIDREGTKLWARKDGHHVHSRNDLLFEDESLMLDIASRFVATWSASRTVWKVTIPATPGALDEAELADIARLAQGMLVELQTPVDRDTVECLVTMVADGIEEDGAVWTRTVWLIGSTPVPQARGLAPQLPTAQDWGAGDADEAAETARDIVDEYWPEPDQQYGPRVSFPTSGGPLAWWTWPLFAGDLPILGWEVDYWAGCEICGDEHKSSVTVDHPWQLHAKFPNSTRWNQGGKAVVRAKTRLGGIEYWFNPKTRLADNPAYVPPNPPANISVFRKPGTPSDVNVGMEWPEFTGNTWLRRFRMWNEGQTTRLINVIQQQNCYASGTVGAAAQVVVLTSFGDIGQGSGFPVAIAAAETLPAVSTAVPGRPRRFAFYRSQAGEFAMWEQVAAGTDGGPTSGQIEITDEAGATRTVAVTQAQYNAGIHDSITATATDASARFRVRNSAGFGPWSLPAALPTPRSPTAAERYTAFRTSSARKASDGWGAVWLDPTDIGNVPAGRGQLWKIGPSVGANRTSAVRNNYITEDSASRRVAVDVDLRVEYPLAGSSTNITSRTVEMQLPALEASNPPRGLIAQYDSYGSNDIIVAAHLPECGQAGQPYQYRVGVNGVWGTPFEIVTAAGSRPALPMVTGDNTKANAIQLQARVEGEAWANSAAAAFSLPANAPFTIDASATELSIPEVHARWMDIAPPTIPAAGTGETNPSFVGEHAATLIVVFDAPVLPSGQTWASTFVQMFVNDRWLYYARETGDTSLHVEIPISDQRILNSAYPENPNRVGVFGGGWVKIVVTPQTAAGLTAEGAPTAGGEATTLYVPLPQYCDLRFADAV